MFDPNKVEIITSGEDGCIYNAPDACVDAEDYDQLLKMYNELKWMYEGLCK